MIPREPWQIQLKTGENARGPPGWWALQPGVPGASGDNTQSDPAPLRQPPPTPEDSVQWRRRAKLSRIGTSRSQAYHAAPTQPYKYISRWVSA